MAQCLSPLKGVREKGGKVVILDRSSFAEYEKDGRLASGVVFQKHPWLKERYSNGISDVISIPCGRCLNCRLNYARKWSERCILESKCWTDNWFVTMTYDDENMPYTVDQETGEFLNGTLVPDDHRGYMKRLRAWYADRFSHEGVRFYMAGEYGDTTFRPHYHELLFNAPLDDLRLYSKSPLGDCYYTSESLSRLWRKGHVIVGELTPQSAAYTARYCQKKANGPPIDYDAIGIHKEYVNMSRRPGIGVPYFEKHWRDIYDHDTIYLPDGRTAKPPRLFDEKARGLGVDVDAIKEERILIANLGQNFKIDEVGVDFYSYLDDLASEVEKSSKVLVRNKI